MAEGYYYDPTQPDESMCQDMTGNWVMCSSMGGDGISGGGTAKECKRSVCWYCDYHAGSIPQTQCGQTSVAVDGPMGCDCGSDSNGECSLKGTKCSIV